MMYADCFLGKYEVLLFGKDYKGSSLKKTWKTIIELFHTKERSLENMIAIVLYFF